MVHDVQWDLVNKSLSESICLLYAVLYHAFPFIRSEPGVFAFSFMTNVWSIDQGIVPNDDKVS